MPVLTIRADVDAAPRIARRIAALTGRDARKIELALTEGNAISVRQEHDLSARLRALGGRVTVVDSHAPPPARR